MDYRVTVDLNLTCLMNRCLLTLCVSFLRTKICNEQETVFLLLVFQNSELVLKYEDFDNHMGSVSDWSMVIMDNLFKISTICCKNNEKNFQVSRFVRLLVVFSIILKYIT